MKTFSEETLMAYADGELDEVTRRAIAQAMQADPALAATVAQHKALRADVFAAFAPVLDEAMPPRLSAAVAAPASNVVELGAVRAARHWTWQDFGGMAAMLVVGIVVGRLALPVDQGLVAAGPDGALAARGALAQALSQQLASAPAKDAVASIGVSFKAQDGNYCRSFAMPGNTGLACRDGDQWKIPVMAATQARQGDYRQASAAMPAAVLDAIDARINGKALDAAAEQAARTAGWK